MQFSTQLELALLYFIISVVHCCVWRCWNVWASSRTFNNTASQ